jgi:hypothetical protein
MQEKEEFMTRTSILLGAAFVLVLAVWGGTIAIDGDPYSAWPESSMQPGINPLVGKWVNIDPETFSFTKMAISIEWGKMMVQVWASCSPEDCEWPRVEAHIPWCETQRIEATWVLPISIDFMDIIYLPEEDRLMVNDKAMYTYDSSGRTDSVTLYFVRGDFPLPE